MNEFNFTNALKEKLSNAETLDEVVKACNEEGIDVTREQLEAAEQYQNSELGEDDLENVTGGYIGFVIFVAVAVLMYWYYVKQHWR